jgi:hypothetical protein
MRCRFGSLCRFCRCHRRLPSIEVWTAGAARHANRASHDLCDTRRPCTIWGASEGLASRLHARIGSCAEGSPDARRTSQRDDEAGCLLSSDRQPRRRLAASRGADRRGHQFSALRADRPDRRARQVRPDVPRRCGRGAGRQSCRAEPLAAIHGLFRPADIAAGDRRDDQAYRARGDGDDELQRALSHRPQIRFARPYAAAARAGTW